MMRTPPSPRPRRDSPDGARPPVDRPARRRGERPMVRLWRWMRHTDRSPAKAVAGAHVHAAVPDKTSTPERAMRQCLGALLDRYRPARAVLRHLAVVEQSLKFPQVYPLDDLAHEHLTIALKQLDRLVHDWSDAGLRALRLMLREHLADRVREEFGTFAPRLSEFVSESRLMVADTTMSSFVSAGDWLDERARQPDAPKPLARTR